ncbi:hypothetical protein ACHAWF_005283 [Thalassiosira exigua]
MSGARNLDDGYCPCRPDPADGGGESLSSSSTSSPSEASSVAAAASTDSLRILAVGGPGFEVIRSMVESDARAYESRAADSSSSGGRPIEIVVESTPSLATMADEIDSNARLDEGYFDGFVSNPGVVGSAARIGAFADLGDFVRTAPELEWADILPAFREVVTTYDGRTYMLPLDGDVHSLFYRRDVLEHFGLKVPRTWDEYVDVAAAVHGEVYDGTTLVGSCVGRVGGCVGQYYASAVLASMTQAGGTKMGHLFDPRDMSPLAGEALAEAIRQLEAQARVGAEDELKTCGGGAASSVNIKHFIDGTCALTYNWGGNFKVHMSRDSKVGGLVGVAPIPGSTRVLDRATGKLVPCDAERCKFGDQYDDIGWVNRAPYAAFGGWAAAVAGNISPMRQRLAGDFFAFASGKRSKLGVIPNATGPIESFNGQDPYRRSHVDIEEWVKQGYADREGLKNYRDTVLSSLNSKNLAVDIRFPGSPQIMDALDRRIFAYLISVKDLDVDIGDRAAQRLAVAEDIANEWKSIIKDIDKKTTHYDQSILVQYQRSLGLYSAPHDYNYIGNVRWFGWTLAIILCSASILFAGWVAVNRKNRIVRASQPFFLILICVGTLIMGAGIFLMGLDDDIATKEGCDIACMATPWMLGCGFSCMFAALYSKTLRVNKLFKAGRFTRITVRKRDVMKPLLAIAGLNVILLSVWTAVNPMVWERIETSPASSYGACEPREKTGAGLVPIVLFGVGNVIILFFANFQAYQARELSDEFSESKYIAISLVSILQAVLVGVPVAVVTRQIPAAFGVIVSGLTFIVPMSVLMLIFAPKVLLVWQKAKEKKELGSQSVGRATGSAIKGILITKMRLPGCQDEDELGHKKKLQELKLKLTEQGIDASTLFQEVGLEVASCISDPSDDPAESDGPPQHESEKD